MTRQRRTRLACALVAASVACAPPIWELPPPPIPDGAVIEPGRVKTVDLDNGLRVLVLEDRRLPRVALGVATRRGAAGVAPARAGLASLTAELMERGAGAWDAPALAEQVDRLGASLSVGAGWDSMSVIVTGLSRDLEALLEVLSEVARRPRFDAAEVASARSQALAALERAKDQPATLAFQHFARTLYPGHRFGLPRQGSPESLRRLERAAVREFHAGVFVPNEAILFASGDLRTDDFVERVRVAFGDWPAGDARAEAPPPPSPAPPERRVVVVDRPDLGQAQLLIGHEGIARTDEDRIAVSLMDSILGSGGFSSRLMRRIRAEGGLTYGVYSMFSMRRRPGPFFVSVATRAPEAGRVVDLVLSELGKVSEAPPTADEIQRAKSGRAGRFALGLETSAALTTALVDLEVYGLPGDSLDTFRARLRAVGAADVERAARAHLFPERAAIVAVGPAEVLQPLLERFGAVEVVDP